MFAVFLALFYVRPIHDAFFNSVLQLSTLAHIDSFLVVLGHAQMPHV
jgi:hypothetical protein